MSEGFEVVEIEEWRLQEQRLQELELCERKGLSVGELRKRRRSWNSSLADVVIERAQKSPRAAADGCETSSSLARPVVSFTR